MPLDSLLPIGDSNKSIPEQGKGRIQFVQEILDGEQTLGYLRITLEEQQMLADKDTRLKVVQEKQRLMLLVALLAGLLISYGIRRNYMRVRKHKKKANRSSRNKAARSPTRNWQCHQQERCMIAPLCRWMKRVDWNDSASSACLTASPSISWIA